MKATGKENRGPFQGLKLPSWKSEMGHRPPSRLASLPPGFYAGTMEFGSLGISDGGWRGARHRLERDKLPLMEKGIWGGWEGSSEVTAGCSSVNGEALLIGRRDTSLTPGLLGLVEPRWALQETGAKVGRVNNFSAYSPFFNPLRAFQIIAINSPS